MPDRTDDLMAGLDGPKPLSPSLRARLEEALAVEAASPRPIDDQLADRLQDALADPTAAVLQGVDAPRLLTDATRRSLERAFGVRHPRRQAVIMGTAAAAVIVLAGGLVVGLRSTPTGDIHSAARNDASTLAPASIPGASGGSGGLSTNAPVGGGATGSVSEATPSAAPTATSAPAITSATPDSGSASGGTQVTILGSGFVHVASVSFGGQDDAFVVVSSTEITATTAAHSPGPVDIVVTLTGGGTSAPFAGYRFA